MARGEIADRDRVGERGHFCVVGSATGPRLRRTSAERSVSAFATALTPAGHRFRLPFTSSRPPMSAVHTDSVRCRRRSRRVVVVRGRRSKVRADPQRVGAQCLGAPTSVNGQQVL